MLNYFVDDRREIALLCEMSITILGQDTLLCVRDFPRESCVISSSRHQINYNTG